MEPSSHALFEILVRENIEMVRAFLLSSVRDPATVEDLVQESFVVAWRNLARYDRQLPFGPWVRGIAGRLLLNHRRKVGRSKMYYCDETVLAAIDREFEGLGSLRGDTLGDKLDVMRACVGKLPEAQRNALALHYETGLHCREIAQRLGLGLEAVKKHLQRGRAGVLRCMQRKMEGVAAT